MRLIDAKHAKDTVTRICSERRIKAAALIDTAIAECLEDFVVHLIDNEPSVDAEPVRHGYVEPDGEGYLRCSVCSEHESYLLYYKYCPNCGAKMEGGTENDKS